MPFKLNATLFRKLDTNLPIKIIVASFFDQFNSFANKKTLREIFILNEKNGFKHISNSKKAVFRVLQDEIAPYIRLRFSFN